MPQNPRIVALRCFACDQDHDLDRLQTVCTACGLPLRVDYDLSRAVMSLPAVSRREPSMWRYREVLPATEGSEVSLTEGLTPLIEVTDSIYVKDESRNPTGSFKARGMSTAVTMAKLLGATALSAPSAGNAAGALAAYGARAGMKVCVAMPDDTPRIFVEECRHYGAEVHLVPGTISDAGRYLAEHRPEGSFDVSTLKEPYRIEGKKTMGYELFEQLGGSLPDVILYPTGGGTGLVGMWKAFDEMEQLGWIDDRRPRLVSVQAAGCAPVVDAFRAGLETTSPAEHPITRAWGLRVPAPIGGFLCLRAIRATGGTAVAIPEAEIAPAAQALATETGLDICPEGGAAWAAAQLLRQDGIIRSEDRVVLFNTGTGLKYR
jgi:threonine synthase